MKIWIIATLLGIVLVGCKEKDEGRRGAPRSATQASGATAKDSEVKSLIEQLASPNRPVNPEGEPFTIKLPEGYDKEAQKRVDLAVERLEGLGKQAFPLLIASSKDERYCRTYPTAVEQDFTVGETCLEILEAQIDHFDGRYGYKGMPKYSFSVINADPEGWWRAHSEMSIESMRLEALRWTIEEERKKLEDPTDHLIKFLGISRSEWTEKCIVPLERQLEELQKHHAEQAAPSDGDKPSN